MLKEPKRNLEEHESRLLMMGATQLMKAVNRSLDQTQINNYVAELRACKTVDDFETLIARLEDEVQANLTDQVSREELEQSTGYVMATTVTRFIVLHIFQDIASIQRKFDADLLVDPDTDIRNFFYDTLMKYFQQEPLKSLIAARPDLEDKLVEAIVVNFNFTQNEHIPKILGSDIPLEERIKLYYAIMMTNSDPDLFFQMLNATDPRSWTRPIRSFGLDSAALAINMAYSPVPTATCPVAHLDSDTRAAVLKFMEKGDDTQD